MYLLGLHNTTPELTISQEESWNILKDSAAARRLKKRSYALVEKVLLGDNGIDQRHFALPPNEALFEASATELNQHFEREAPALGTQALLGALGKSQLNPAELDALFVCSCTGYLCPGLSSYLSERLNLRSNAFLQDNVGQGCGAAIPTLESAANYLARFPSAKVGVLAVEICSATFYLDDDPGVIISACLFGDGASASIWTGEGDGLSIDPSSFDRVHIPEKRESLRFVSKEGKLRNILKRSVPETVGGAVSELHRRASLSRGTQVIPHPGGRDVLHHLAKNLKDFNEAVPAEILRRCGNMSSPSVLFVLEEALKQNATPRDLWLTAYGAGFTCFSCRIRCA